jgi:hypothetical protein
VGTKTAEKKADVKAPQKEATIEPVTKQASEADKESEASVNVTVKKVSRKMIRFENAA